MNSIGFSSTISYSKTPQGLGKRCVEWVDGYLDPLFCGNRRVEVLFEDPNMGSEGCVELSRQKGASPIKTALKVISYCTLILPVLALMVKAILRCTYKYHLIDTSYVGATPPPQIKTSAPDPYRFLGDTQNSGMDGISRSDIAPTELVVDQVYKLSREEIVKLQLKYSSSCNHRLVNKIKEEYKAIPRIDICKSDLPLYEKSYFEVIDHTKYDPRSDTNMDRYYEVVRRGQSENSWRFDEIRRLSANETADLKIYPIDQESGFSAWEAYKDSKFYFIFSQGQFIVTRTRMERNYPYIPLNRGVHMSPEEGSKLLNNCKFIGLKGDGDDQRSVFSSTIPEYSQSVILVKEESPHSCFMRMLRSAT